MAEFGNVNAWGSCSGGSGRRPSSVVGLCEDMELHESRFQVIESSLRDMQDDMRIWRDLVQEGLADLSIQLKAMSQQSRVAQKRNLEVVMEKDAAVSKRLFEVEKQMQGIQMTIQKDPNVVARLCTTERHLQELQSTINKMQHQDFQDVQHGHDKVVDQLHVLRDTCLRLEKTLEKSPQQMSLLHPDQKLHLQVHEPPQPELKGGQATHTHGIVWPQPANHVQQHSGVASYASSVRMTSDITTWPQRINQTPPGKENDVNRKLGYSCAIPVGQCGPCRTSTYGRGLAGQPARVFVHSPHVRVSAPMSRESTWCVQ